VREENKEARKRKHNERGKDISVKEEEGNLRGEREGENSQERGKST